MRKFYLTFMALMGMLTISAQPIPSTVANPGGKGNLPQIPVIAPARANEFTGLDLETVGYDSWIVNGNYRVVAHLSFPIIATYEGEYYTVQYRATGSAEWSHIMDGDNPVHYDGYTVGITPYLYGKTDYRLVIHGGPMDGYVSNIVTATPPPLLSRYTGWSEDPSIEHCMVDIPVGEEFTVSVSSHIDGSDYSYSTEDEVFTYKWYRRNPNNWDMEEIPGATERIYTPTLNDVGYQLVIEVAGDGEHTGFTLRHPLHGVVCVPVQASLSYVGPDGFILATDYVIPNPQEMFVRSETWVDDPAEFNPECISVRNPGEYVFSIPENQFDYCIYELSNPGYYLTFYYEEMEWYREVQIMCDRYKGILGVKATLAGNNVPTTIDVIGLNIEGEWTVVASKPFEAADEWVMFDQDWENETDERLFYGFYYVKARATQTTKETYYPSAGNMETAMPVLITSDNSWDAKYVEIAVQSISGVNTMSQPEAAIDEIWSVDGSLQAAPVPGVNIMRMSDGTVRKTLK
ncbi:MAG: hypothetical protein J6W99_04255 [Bacteroidaceae bacterium]|nr:hypothetical protein [Bacteroidaceae bacterium]